VPLEKVVWKLLLGSPLETVIWSSDWERRSKKLFGAPLGSAARSSCLEFCLGAPLEKVVRKLLLGLLLGSAEGARCPVDLLNDSKFGIKEGNNIIYFSKITR
jgi:hypothetical protein